MTEGAGSFPTPSRFTASTSPRRATNPTHADLPGNAAASRSADQPRPAQPIPRRPASSTDLDPARGTAPLGRQGFASPAAPPWGFRPSHQCLTMLRNPKVPKQSARSAAATSERDQRQSSATVVGGSEQQLQRQLQIQPQSRISAMTALVRCACLCALSRSPVAVLCRCLLSPTLSLTRTRIDACMSCTSDFEVACRTARYPRAATFDIV